MTDHINFFEPYESKQAHHEDQLTRAFLVLLRHVPLVHATWLSLVDQGHRRNKGAGVPALHQLPEARFHTQSATLPVPVNRVVSLVQTDDHYFLDQDVKQSTRRQVLDGVVSYQPDLAIVMENKPSAGDVWEGQLAVNLGDSHAEHDPRTASVSWRDLIEAVGKLVAAGHLSGSEGQIAEDFLGFVERRFPQLQPYRQFELCRDNVELLSRRCRAILDEIAPGRIEYHRGWGWYIALPDSRPARQISLTANSRDSGPQIRLELDPGDTMGQARLLYGRLDAARLRSLRDRGWQVTPNFHLSFMSSNLLWTTVTRDLDSYVSYWTENMNDILQVQRDRFRRFIDELIGEGLASESDREGFNRHFLSANRATLNVCPGLTLRRWWRLPEAKDLDARGAMVPAVCDAASQALAAWADKLPARTA